MAQNERIVGLLAWRTDRKNLRENLEGLRQNSAISKGGALNQREIMIFLQDLLDALFSILMDGNMKEYDESILSGLATLIQLLANERFKHFQAVLETYIQECFSHTLAAVRLIALVTKRIETRITQLQFSSAQSDVSDRYAGKKNIIKMFFWRNRTFQFLGFKPMTPFFGRSKFCPNDFLSKRFFCTMIFISFESLGPRP